MENAGFLHAMVVWLVETVGSLGYAGVFLLMAVESSFVPFPSEVVVVPAGYLAQQGKMHIGWVIACGIAGSIAGAYVNYFIASRLGRPFILRYGHYVGVSPEKFSKVERYFARHGEITTFVGRLLPGIRQLISFPAGLGRMRHGRFVLYTAAGSGLWVTILAILGFWIGEQQDLLKRYLKEISTGLIIGAVVLVLAYVYIQRRRAALAGEAAMAEDADEAG